MGLVEPWQNKKAPKAPKKIEGTGAGKDVKAYRHSGDTMIRHKKRKSTKTRRRPTDLTMIL